MLEAFSARASRGLQGSNYADGHVFWYVPGVPRDQAFAADWADYNNEDLAFRLTFSLRGVTINGTRKDDKVDATHTVKGQPLPGANDDTIIGKKGEDKLSGLAGNDLIDGGKDNDKLKGGDGDDDLIGGKGKDKLLGEAGADTFLFNVSLKEAPDKLKGFAAADDTIQVDDAIFSVFVQGALAGGSSKARCTAARSWKRSRAKTSATSVR